MKKRYDYHSLVHAFKLLLAVSFFFVFFFWHLHSTSKNSSPIEVVLISITIGILLIVSLLGYYSVKITFIEISEEGILFNGLTKRVYSPWAEVREIKLLGRIDKIYTANGNFYIRVVELSDDPKLSMKAMMMTKRSKIKDALVDEIKKRSPHARVTQSIFLRPL
jgi:hypothetical protein